QYLDVAKGVKEKLDLTPQEIAFFRNEVFWDIPDRRLEEIQSKSFTALDIHHLETTFLFHDAAQALRNDFGQAPEPKAPGYADFQLQLAKHAFDWAMREVDLRSKVVASD